MLGNRASQPPTGCVVFADAICDGVLASAELVHNGCKSPGEGRCRWPS